jgi:hypothetical protein
LFQCSFDCLSLTCSRLATALQRQKSHKIIGFAASDKRGVRSQKLIKLLNYTRLATVLQGRKAGFDGSVFLPAFPAGQMKS